MDMWETELEARAQAAGNAFSELVKTIARLRHPTKGCPWDLKQTHESLRHYMLEEAYEASAALAGSSAAHMLEELGDVLLQVVLNAQLAADNKTFTIVDVAKCINDKMLRRHPHVFNSDATENPNMIELHTQWERIKKEEKKSSSSDPSLFKDESKIFPSLLQAYKIGKRAKSIAFDWSQPDEVFAQFLSEVNELQEEWCKSQKDPKAIREELGDVYFTLTQFARHMGWDAESVAQDGNSKFLKRFRVMETLAKEKNIFWDEASSETKEQLWREAKKKEK